ncbi:MAG: hypothetical protein P8M12_03245 [Flavobacteriales bacterium]|nr:hypothetical protein [Flavobacteriales bacterium]
MEFKRFKRKGVIFNNNSQGIGLEVKLAKKLKVFRIERSKEQEDNSFDYSIFDGQKTIDGVKKNEIVTFLEEKESEYSFFEGELKLWKKIK